MRLYLAENEMAYEVVESLVGSDHARSLVGLSAERFGTLHDRTTGLSRARQASWLHGGFLLRLGGLHGRRFLHLQPISQFIYLFLYLLTYLLTYLPTYLSRESVSSPSTNQYYYKQKDRKRPLTSH